jgi:transcriptional regulator with XRE-family HTH domain
VKPSRVKRELSRLVRETRVAGKLRQADVAARGRLSRAAVSGVETGRMDPTLTTFFRLAAGLGVDPASFVLGVYEAVTAGRPQEEAWTAAR